MWLKQSQYREISLKLKSRYICSIELTIAQLICQFNSSLVVVIHY